GHRRRVSRLIVVGGSREGAAVTQHDAPGWQADAAFVPAHAAHGRRSSAVVLLAFGLFAVSILVFVVGLAFGVRGDDVPLLVLASVMSVAGAIPLLMDQARLPERRHVLLSMLAIVFIVQFVVPVLAIYIPAVGPADPSG